MIPRLSVFCATSLDGYIATEDGGIDWLLAAASPDEDYGYDAFIASVDAVAMGRRTYDAISGHERPAGSPPVVVFTHTPPAPAPEVSFWSVTPLQALERWTDAGLRRVYVDGGRLVSSFLAEGLIDDMLITVVPVLLGSGRPLFHPSARTTHLALDSVTPFPSGLVNLQYARIPAGPHGTARP